MQKVLLAIIISLFSTTSFAKFSKEQLLNISLTNTGAESCLLQSADIKKGKLYKSAVPTTLKFSGEAQKYGIYGKVAELTLSYNCGTNKNITIYMKKYFKKFGDATLISQVINSENVFAKHEDKPGFMQCTYPPNFPAQCFAKESSISWSFTN